MRSDGKLDISPSLCYILSNSRRGKPFARRGRKAMGLSEIAKLPRRRRFSPNSLVSELGVDKLPGSDLFLT